MSPTQTKTTRRRRAVSAAEKLERRDEIMSAAKKVFAEKGFNSTTIADIAKEAGLSYGSVYWYFDSKDALFDELMAVEEQALRTHLEQALGRLDEAAASEDAFRIAVRATFEFFEGDRDTVRLLFRDSIALGDRFEKHLQRIYERFIDDIEALVATARDRGDIIDAPPRMIAFSLAALIGQLALRRLTTDDGVAAEVAADFVVSLVLDGLRPRPTPPRRSP